MLHRWRIRNAAEQRIFVAAERFDECRIDPRDQRGRRTKVADEFDRPWSQGTDTAAPRTLKQADVGIAKTVDRLHRIANDEKRSAVVDVPFLQKPREQPIVDRRRVLELVDQYMLDTVIEGQCQVRRRVRVAERSQRRERDFGEIECTGASKRFAEFDDEYCERRGDGVDVGQFVDARAARWQLPNRGELLHQAASIEFRRERFEFGFLARRATSGCESLRFAEAAPGLPVAGGEQVRNEGPSVECVRQSAPSPVELQARSAFLGNTNEIVRDGVVEIGLDIVECASV
ncbi:MAG TPA: hypothetical protein VFG38_16555 [Pseudomonadales bacterium]|nr:hypothetical protein [Pseudomonadales bacterium]